MDIKREEVILRQIIPAEGKVIKNIITEEYFTEGLYLGKEEDENNYIEVDISEVPSDEPEVSE